MPGPEPSNSAAQGAPTISGTAQVDETLTAGTSGITDANGMTNVSYTYQWIRVNTDSTETDISGATGGTHTWWPWTRARPSRCGCRSPMMRATPKR